MNKRTLAIFALISVVALCAGCASTNTRPVTQRNSSLTTGNVEMHMKVGVTTKAQILQTFGAPNITTTDGSGKDVWVYQRAATVTQSSSRSTYWTVILTGGSGSASGFQQTQRMMTLIIKFGNNGVVTDFSSRSSQF